MESVDHFEAGFTNATGLIRRPSEYPPEAIVGFDIRKRDVVSSANCPFRALNCGASVVRGGPRVGSGDRHEFLEIIHIK